VKFVHAVSWKHFAEQRGFKADGYVPDERRRYLGKLRNRSMYKDSLPISNRNTVSPKTLVRQAAKYVSFCPRIRTTSRVAISRSMSIAPRRYTSCGPLDLHKHMLDHVLNQEIRCCLRKMPLLLLTCADCIRCIRTQHPNSKSVSLNRQRPSGLMRKSER
jgi:hypothetical protein